MTTPLTTQNPSPSSQTRPWYRHPAAVAVGAVAGSILLIGGAIAIVLEATDDFWSSEYSPASQSAPAPAPDPLAAPPAAPVEAAQAEGAAATISSDADQVAMSFASAIDAAVTAANGVGATSVALSGGMHEVDVLLADGREIDVYVGTDGRAVVESVPYVEPSGDPAIDTTRLAAIVDAALVAAAGAVGEAGTISELSTTTDPGRAFEVTVTSPSDIVYVELSDALAVVELDRDSD